jgi:hypothetical protein
MFAARDCIGQELSSSVCCIFQRIRCRQVLRSACSACALLTDYAAYTGTDEFTITHSELASEAVWSATKALHFPVAMQKWSVYSRENTCNAIQLQVPVHGRIGSVFSQRKVVRLCRSAEMWTCSASL